MRRNLSCSTCAHYGCCETPCGGLYWTSDAPEQDDGYEDFDVDEYNRVKSERWQEQADRRW